MRKLKIKLKQHTPLIHFQHDQEGATLRASEVKPKLDNYILTQLGNGNREAGVKIAKPKGWLIGKEGHYALAYKLRIEATERINSVKIRVDSKCDRNGNVKFSTDPFPFLLANMGGKEKEEELMNLSMHEKVEATFIIQNDALFDIINKNIERFFALHNFGQRQTKGFGSFSVVGKKIDDQDMQNVPWDHKSYFDNGTPLMSFQTTFADQMLEKQNMIFSVLDFYWRCLKSGINYSRGQRNSGKYIKSFLYIYLNNNHYTWEKRWIKTKFGIAPREINSDDSITPTFARGLMGCPDKYEFRLPGRSTQTINIKNISESIDRISSPIYFKPYIDGNNVKVYILIDNVVVKKLRELTDREKIFMFSSGQNRHNLSLFPESISYIELVRKFHYYMFTNSNFVKSDFGEYRNGWKSASITERQNEKGITVRLWGDFDISWKMIPRNYQWKNILNPNDNGKKNYVSFSQIAKK